MKRGVAHLSALWLFWGIFILVICMSWSRYAVAEVKVFSLLAPNQVPTSHSDIKPYISGYAYRFDWAKLQPGPEEYNWDLVRQAVRQTKSLGKVCMIHLTAGVKSPGWVAPFLDRQYLDAWKRFLTEFAQEFGGEPCIWALHISGCGAAGELTLKGYDGFTDEAVMEAWKEVIPWYVGLFSDKVLYTPGVTPDMAERPGGSALFVQYILDNYPERIGIYNHGLGGRNGQPHDLIRQAVKMFGIGGYQAGGCFLLGWGWPNWGDPKIALQKAIEDKVTSVEVYRSDLLKGNRQFNQAVQLLAEGLSLF
jgi:hypothetical protein